MTLPPAVDLPTLDPLGRSRQWSRQPPVQLSNDDCTSIALAGAVEYLEWRRGNDEQLSNVYLHSRATTEYPQGHPDRITIEQGLTVLSARGICRWKLWPYRGWESFHGPPRNGLSLQEVLGICDKDALQHRILGFERLSLELVRSSSELEPLRRSLAAGSPVVFGHFTYTSSDPGRYDMWQDWVNKPARTLPVPTKRDQWYGGQHDVVAIGYDDTKRAVRIRNSERPRRFWMPYDFILAERSTTDFYVITGLAA